MSSGAKDYGLRAGTLGVPVLLAPHVLHVRTGTPLRPGPLGWEIAPINTVPEGFAGTSGHGGEKIGVVRTAILASDTEVFLAGQRYRLADIWWQGHPEFVADPGGPYLAWSPFELFIEAGVAGAPVEQDGEAESVEHSSVTDSPVLSDSPSVDNAAQEETDGAW